MRDAKFIIHGRNTMPIASEFIGVYELPRVGEYITTAYFQKKFDDIRYDDIFIVSKIVHHYVDDMSGIDYTEIILKRMI